MENLKSRGEKSKAVLCAAVGTACNRKVWDYIVKWQICSEKALN